ncbi:MAG: hypothetical protein ACQEQV_00260 [Fibrobacterota bacterium]
MTQIGEKLNELTDTIKNTAAESVESLLMDDVAAVGEWKHTAGTLLKSDHILSVSSSNHAYQAVILFGISNDAASEYAEDKDEIQDLFGEVANTFFGLIADNTAFSEYFGFLEQSIPIYSVEESACHKVDSLVGELEIEGGSRMKVVFAARKSREAKKDEKQ